MNRTIILAPWVSICLATELIARSAVGAIGPVTPGARYAERSSASNDAITGNSSEGTITTQASQMDTTVIVALDGSGNYTTVQAAFRAVPKNYAGRWTIFVKKGRYHEKDTLATGKVNVVLTGEDRDSTVIWNDDYGDKYGSGNPGTSGSFTLSIDADDFIAKNITIQNTYAPQPGVSGSQAVALSVNGDRQEYYNVALRGFQDTYYTRGSRATGRTYHKNCIIEGTVDFIFGRNIAVFDSCTIRELRNGGTLTAASTEASSQFGYVFRNCTISADPVGYDGARITSFYLGRPWQASPRTVFLRCSEPATLHAAGWLAWNVTPALYGEYKCTGSVTTGRVTWSSQLTDSVAAQYTLKNIFARSSANSSLIVNDWMPTGATAADDEAVVTSVETGSTGEPAHAWFMSRNFPNPFNPSTTIRFQVAEVGLVSLKVYDLLGKEIGVLVNEVKSAGEYAIRWDAAEEPSGVYLYFLQAGSRRWSGKMVLLK